MIALSYDMIDDCFRIEYVDNIIINVSYGNFVVMWVGLSLLRICLCYVGGRLIGTFRNSKFINVICLIACALSLDGVGNYHTMPITITLNSGRSTFLIYRLFFEFLTLNIRINVLYKK